MSKRRPWAESEGRDMARYAHAVLLDGIFRARRWEKAEIAFQGGTCLNLVYGSPRFSEDIDFLIRPDRDTGRVMSAALRHLKHRLLTDFPDGGYTASLKRRDGEDANPKMYEVGISAEQRVGKVRVKTEFWVTPSADILAAGYPTQARQTVALNLPSMRVTLPPVPLQAGELTSIFRDKIRAIATRAHLKYRDCFDVWWMFETTDLRNVAISDVVGKLPDHLEMYPNGIRAAKLPDALRERASELESDLQRANAEQDIPRWFEPHLASMYGPAVVDMISSTVNKIRLVADEVERQFPASQPRASTQLRARKQQ